MNFFKRGLLSITRKKGKSLILLLIIFILGNLIAGAISIQQATDSVETTIKERLGTAATLDMDYEALNQMSDAEMMEFEWSNLSLDVIRQVGELDYVKYFDYSTSTYLASDDLQPYQGENNEYAVDYGSVVYQPEFHLKGTNYAPVIDFQEEKSQLVDGRVFTDEEISNGSAVTIISKKFADLNQLSVGDSIVLTNGVVNYTEEGEELYDSRDVILEVIGLFETLTQAENSENDDNGMWDWMDIEAQNMLYVPNDLIIEEERYRMEKQIEMDPELAMYFEGEDYEQYYTPIYVLNSVDDVEPFTEEVMPLLPEMYIVKSAVDQYDNVAGPIQSMSKLSGYVLIVSVIASILIIGLVVLLFLRDRKRELGIYLSLGERRGRVIGQILIEVMVVAIIGVALSLFTGNLLANGVSDTLMSNDSQNQGFDDYYYYGDLETNITADDVLDTYEVQLSPTYILWFLVVGLLTVLVSTIIPLLYIVRLNPKKILM